MKVDMTNLNTGILPRHRSLREREVCFEVVPLFLGTPGCSVAGHGWNLGSYRWVIPPGDRYELVGVCVLLIYLCSGWVSSSQDVVQNERGQHNSLCTFRSQTNWCMKTSESVGENAKGVLYSPPTSAESVVVDSFSFREGSLGVGLHQVGAQRECIITY